MTHHLFNDEKLKRVFLVLERNVKRKETNTSKGKQLNECCIFKERVKKPNKFIVLS
jgi:hypothetical protein